MELENVEIVPRVAVVGVGGAGCNVASYLYRAYPEADIIAVNTDRDALHSVEADKKLYICRSVTKGEGTKGDVRLGKSCAQAHLEEIEAVLSGYDVAFVIAGMGGGTGSGAAPVIAEISGRLGLITIAVPIMPFSFETARVDVANLALSRLKAVCGITIPYYNDHVLKSMPEVSMNEAFRAVNRNIASTVKNNVNKIADAFLEQLSEVKSMHKDEDLGYSATGFATGMADD